MIVYTCHMNGEEWTFSKNSSFLSSNIEGAKGRNHSRRFFFFSSRRRHTRLVSDWSSDVCSSDLELDRLLAAAVEGQVGLNNGIIFCCGHSFGGSEVINCVVRTALRLEPPRRWDIPQRRA